MNDRRQGRVGGHTPVASCAFQQDRFQGPDDAKLHDLNPVDDFGVLVDNHGLTATDSEDNLAAIQRMKELVG